MDTKDLMVGDWVLHDGEPYQIRQLGIYGVNRDGEDYPAVCVGKPKGIGLIVERNEIAPIPLTVEILEKNGFVKYNEVSDTPPYDQDEEGNMYYSFKGEHKFWGWWQPNNVYFIPLNAMIDLEIKFVHELQHAIRLCGIDKEIEI
jgi:hypothetical protein